MHVEHVEGARPPARTLSAWWKFPRGGFFFWEERLDSAVVGRVGAAYSLRFAYAAAASASPTTRCASCARPAGAVKVGRQLWALTS